MKRIRVVEGSCWSCKRRRVKCNLGKPTCEQCRGVGAKCDYGKVVLRWSTRPSPFQTMLPSERAASSLGLYQKRSLDYFEACLWPLFTVDSNPSPCPVSTAIEDRTVLQATCVLADAHRYLLDKRNSETNLQLRRVDCLATVRSQLQQSPIGTPIVTADKRHYSFLFAILLLYFLDGYIDCKRDFAATLSHHAGVKATINCLGGFNMVRSFGDEAFKILLSQFATADLSTAMLRCTVPSFSPDIWTTMCAHRVWWATEASDALMLAKVFQEISAMIFYANEIEKGLSEMSLERIASFEASFGPVYDSIASSGWPEEPRAGSSLDFGHVNRRAFLHSYQHSASIFLYRVICGLPLRHYLVQQHVYGCINIIVAMDESSKSLNCVLLPLCIAGSHVQSAGLRALLLTKLEVIHQHLKFESVISIKQWLLGLWESLSPRETWTELFQNLNHQAAVV